MQTDLRVNGRFFSVFSRGYRTATHPGAVPRAPGESSGGLLFCARQLSPPAADSPSGCFPFRAMEIAALQVVLSTRVADCAPNAMPSRLDTTTALLREGPPFIWCCVYFVHLPCKSKIAPGKCAASDLGVHHSERASVAFIHSIQERSPAPASPSQPATLPLALPP